eukprot:symbB.v1.2.002785.t1/scaffold150.1/size295742/4
MILIPPVLSMCRPHRKDGQANIARKCHILLFKFLFQMLTCTILISDCLALTKLLFLGCSLLTSEIVAFE